MIAGLVLHPRYSSNDSRVSRAIADSRLVSCLQAALVENTMYSQVLHDAAAFKHFKIMLMESSIGKWRAVYAETGRQIY